MQIKDIMSITSYQELFEVITDLSKKYIKNGDTILYIENGKQKRVEDTSTKKGILSIIELYIQVDKMLKEGIEISEIDRNLREGRIQNKIQAYINEKFQQTADDKSLFEFAKEIVRSYDETETQQEKAYQLLREDFYTEEAIKIMKFQKYIPNIRNNTDIVYIIKQAQSLNLDGDAKDCRKDLLFNYSFIAKLKALEKKFKENDGRIEWNFDGELLQTAKKFAAQYESLSTSAENDRKMANAYVKKEARLINKEQDDIIKFNDRNVVNLSMLKPRRRITFLEIPKAGHIALIRILLKRNGFLAKQKEENGQFFIEMLPVEIQEKNDVDVEPKE